MGARFLSSAGLRSGNLIERAQFFPVPVLDKSRPPHNFFSGKGRSETDPLGRVISESCLRSLEPRSRSQKMLSIKGGVSYAIFWGSVCHIFYGHPLISTDFYAIRTPIVWHILGAYFLQIWGMGVVRIIFNKFWTLSSQKFSRKKKDL